MKTLLQNLVTLPPELMREHIMPYIRYKQPNDLCEDIRSYVECRNYLINLYIERYQFLGENNTEWLEWLDNDIQRFMNEDITQMLWFSTKCIDRYKRLYTLSNKSDLSVIDNLWHNYIRNNSLNSVLINLGILNPDEREDLVIFVHILQTQLGT